MLAANDSTSILDDVQVKRQKPGQVTSVQPAPKVLPLTKAPSGKVVVATPAPTPCKIKLMARPQVLRLPLYPEVTV